MFDKNFLDKSRHAPDRVLIALVVILTVFGLVMVYSSSFMLAVKESHSAPYYLVRQLAWALIGVIALLVGLRIQYDKWRLMALPLMVTTLILLVLVLVLPQSVTRAGGAERWIRIGPIGIQPSEVCKFTLIVYLGSWLVGRGHKLRSMSFGLLPFGIIMGIILGLIMLQRNLSTAIILSVIGLTIFFAAGANLLHIGVGSALAGAMGWILMTTVDYRNVRFLVFKDPWAYPREGGFQPIHAMYALASGGLWGRGLGQSRQKFSWLPSPHADAIFSIIGEEMGLIETVGVLVTFPFLAYRGFRIASRSSDPFAALLAVGITSWICFQAFVNMAVVAQVIPFTGQTLPFISYGGSSLAMCLFAVGVLLNVSKHVDDAPPQPIVVPESKPQARKQRAVALFPNLAFMRGRNRGPRVSGTGRRFGLARPVAQSGGAKLRRGWQRWSKSSRRREKSGPVFSGDNGPGYWRKRS
ncbi:MAG: putative lipid II flippase FtsW [Herpetosiphon sp.]